MKTVSVSITRSHGFFRKLMVRAAKRSALALKSFAGWLTAYPTTDAKCKIFEGGKPPAGGSPDMALAGNLSTLAAQGRHVERGTCMGRAVAEAWKADLVGSGIAVSPKSGDKTLDALLTVPWKLFCECACVDGMPLWEWQAMMIGSLPPAGAGLSRFVLIPERIAQGLIPLALLPLEIEWLSEEAVASVPADHKFVRGIELDKFGRPQFYHLRNPETLDITSGERVPAAQIVHIFEKRRAQQSHGEPVLAPAIERIMQGDRLPRIELDAAVNSSAPSVAIKTQRALDIGDDDEDPTTDIPPGAVVRLLPGEDIATVPNSRPSQLIEPFISAMRGDVAAATRVNRQVLDRDYQRSTFMNSRMSNQDTDRLQASIKSAANRMLAGRIYEAAFPWLMMAIGRPMPADPRKLAQMMRYAVRPDARPYVDPVKDVASAVNAIAQNLSTYHIECAARGKDFDEIIAERKLENDALQAAGLPVPTVIKPSTQPQQKKADGEEIEDEEAAANA